MINRPVLQLNASLEPMRIVRARKALKMVTKGKAVVVVPTNMVVFPGIFVPSVIRLVEYKNVPYRMQQATRKNILLRDGNRCQYCGRKFKPQELTLDHVVPKSRGGKSTWDNLVAACHRDNHRKADRTPEEAGMPLIRRPLPMTIHTHRSLLMMMGSDVKEWNRFLWGDSNGDQRHVTYAA